MRIGSIIVGIVLLFLGVLPYIAKIEQVGKLFGFLLQQNIYHGVISAIGVLFLLYGLQGGGKKVLVK